MKKVLIIDDSSMIRNIARMIVERLGFEAVEAGDGQEALTLCHRERPDAILIDWDMPGMSGLDFLNTYSGQMIGRKPVLIYCVTEYIEENVNQAMHAGADVYLMKPFDLRSVRQILTDTGLLQSA